MKSRILVTVIILSIILTACGGDPTRTKTLRVMTHDSFSIPDETLLVFEQEHDVALEFLASGDSAAALSKAILSAGNPIADVFYGVDNTFLSRALDEDIFEAYESPELANIPSEFKLDPDFRALPVDYGDVCVNFDVTYFAEEELSPPTNLNDLLEDDYKGMLVVEDPTISSPGLAFLLATIAEYGEDGYLEYWTNLVENDVLVVSDWENAYYNEFSYWGGTRPLAVSYASSVPFEFLFIEPPVKEELTGAVLGANACFRQIEFVGILKGTEKRDLAEKWIDFMLSTTFQKELPFAMAVYPVNRLTKIDEDFLAHSYFPDEPAALDPEYISANREKWITAWREVVLK